MHRALPVTGVGVVMRVLVTGGAGFLGSHLCERLVASGCQVVCLDNLSTGSADNVSGLLGRPGFRLLLADVVEAPLVPDPVDAVLHLASPASPVDYLRMPVATLRAGSAGTLHALEVARQSRARFVLASTSEAYGDPQVHPQTESYWGHVNPVGPRAVYDEAKRFAEAATMAYRRAYGLDTGIARIFNTFGPRMRPDDGRAIPTFIRQALTGQPLTVTGQGSQTRSICYVDDLVDGLVRLLHSPLAGPVNLGNPHEISMLDLARWVRDLVGSSAPVTHIPRPQDDPAVRRPDITLARAELGWSPRTPVGDALEATIAWFRERLGLVDIPPCAVSASPADTGVGPVGTGTDALVGAS